MLIKSEEQMAYKDLWPMLIKHFWSKFRFPQILKARKKCELMPQSGQK